MPRAPEPRDHLVRAEQDAVLVAEGPHALEIARRRSERAARVLHRLHDHHRHGLGPGLHDRGLQLVEQEARELGLGLLGRPVVAVGVRHVQHVRHQRLEGRAQLGAPGERQRPERGAVVGHPPGDGLPAPLAAGAVILAGELPRRLGGLGAARDEERPVEVAGGEIGQLRGQLDRPGVGEGPVDRERQLAHLRRGRLAHLGAVAVADVHAEEPGEGVEVALAVRVLEVAAVAPDDHLELLRVGIAAHLREVEPEVV